MADFACAQLRPAIELTIEDQGATDARPEGDAYAVLRANCGAVFPFAVSHGVRVVLDRRREAGPLLNDVAQRCIDPAGDVRQLMHDSVHAIDDAGQANADANGGRRRAKGVHDFDQRADDGIGVAATLGVDDSPASDDVSIEHQAGFNGGSAEIDANGVSHLRKVGEGAARLRVLCYTRACGLNPQLRFPMSRRPSRVSSGSTRAISGRPAAISCAEPPVATTWNL